MQHYSKRALCVSSRDTYDILDALRTQCGYDAGACMSLAAPSSLYVSLVCAVVQVLIDQLLLNDTMGQWLTLWVQWLLWLKSGLKSSASCESWRVASSDSFDRNN